MAVPLIGIKGLIVLYTEIGNRLPSPAIGITILIVIIRCDFHKLVTTLAHYC